MMRLVLRCVLVLVALVAALITQSAIIPSLRLLPVLPNVVLVMVVGIALSAGPIAGASAGFLAGLLVDSAPPAVGMFGGSVLVLAMVGAAAGYAHLLPVRSAVVKVPLTAAVMAAATAMWVAGMSALNEALGLITPGHSWVAVVNIMGPLVLMHLAASPVLVPLMASLVGVGPQPLAAGELLPAQRGAAHVRKTAVVGGSALATPVVTMGPSMIGKSRAEVSRR